VLQASESLSCQGDLGLLLPHLAVAVVDKAVVHAGLVCIWARARAGGAACPRCGTWCTRVHDSYTRRLADAGIGGRRVVIWLRVRLLRCGNGACEAATFAEQPGGLASRYARRTPLLERELTAVAVALAGRAGCRLAAVLAVEVSRDTLIRVLTALPEPAGGSARVLGVDDFSLRRGSTYATLLVDMEAGVPVDVLPDREAATLEAWLREHPGAEVICRDRAGAYDRAARAGAPDADQVADRWHLWHNLCEHARKAVARHKDCLTGPAHACLDQPGQDQDQDRNEPEQEQQEQQEPEREEQEPEREEQEPEREEQEPEPGGVPDGLETIIAGRHQAVHQLRAAGQTQAQAAAALGLSLQLTGRYWRAASAGQLLAVRGPSALDPYKPYLRARWDQGATTIAALQREITALGYPGGYTTLYAWLGLLKLAAPARPPAPPTPGQVTGWILRDPARLDPAGAAALQVITARCPELDALARHVTGFAKILTGRHGARLDAWMAAVDADPGQPDLQSFTTGIRQDYQAVRNGLTLPWSSGLVEGLNTRTKLLKRQMYGRAAFPLLRKRILLTS
jgi:transposase